jgi:hypothetical protein
LLARKKGGDAFVVDNVFFVLAAVVVVVTGISAAVFLSRKDLGSLSIKARIAKFGLEVEMKNTANNKSTQKRN